MTKIVHSISYNYSPYTILWQLSFCSIVQMYAREVTIPPPQKKRSKFSNFSFKMLQPNTKWLHVLYWGPNTLFNKVPRFTKIVI